MNENQAGQNKLLDTTDCLEAVGVFRGWKNFLFVIVILCLLLLQISFWLVDAGYIGTCEENEGDEAAAVAGIPRENVQDIDEAAKKVATKANQPAEAISQEPQQSAAANSLFGIQFVHLAWLVRFVNAALILTATLYCLTMLFSLKISLIGRLGGINHICRAFFISLVMLILLLPWQSAFGCVVKGAMYTPCELKACSAETSGIFGSILYYLRFTGYWLLIMLLLILSHVRSCRWTKAILRRLEVM
jgi:hypothetical protein